MKAPWCVLEQTRFEKIQLYLVKVSTRRTMHMGVRMHCYTVVFAFSAPFLRLRHLCLA